MQDIFAYCAELVRANDRDRFLAALFAPAERRGALHALHAFNIEVSRARDVAREPLPGEIRLQWWRDVINGERVGEANANPVAAALLAVMERHQLATATLNGLIDAHRFDLYDEPMARLSDLEAYARHTGSALFSLAAQILGDADRAAGTTDPAGLAYGITGVLRAFPQHASRRQLYVPIEILSRHGVDPEQIFSGRPSVGLIAALTELGAAARQLLAAAAQHLPALPRQVLPALLPLALVRPWLDCLERHDAFAVADIPPWRRQWLIWRATRKPARIAG
jgi:15-cis-phytoene synthase